MTIFGKNTKLFFFNDKAYIDSILAFKNLIFIFKCRLREDILQKKI